MIKSKLLSLAATLTVAFFIACGPVLAQWQVPLDNIPLGRGAGTGFGSIPIPSLTPASVKAYGATGSGFSTTGTISAASRTLTLASAIDLKNGNGIFIQSAGAATSVGSPTLTAVTAINTTGATTYAYKIASKSNSGGLKAATAATTITNGHATLGTYGAGTAGIAMNQITWTNGSGSPLCTAVWRSKSGGAYQLLGCFTGTSIFDSGLPTQVLFGLPTLPPAANVADDLVTTISSGGGTTTLTLAAAATTAATATGITHEDTAAINTAAAANTSIYFPPGTYIVSGLQFPSTLHTVKGDGAGLSNIFAIAQTSDGFVTGVSSSMNAGKFYMSGMKIEAAIPMAYNGFVLHFAYKSGIYDSEFVGRTALKVVFGKDAIIQNNQITGWWDIGIHDSTNGGSTEISGNIIHPISGQAGAVALGATPSGSDYVWAAGIVSEGGTTGSRHIASNNIDVQGGAFGIIAQSVDPVIENNVIRHTGRECIQPGTIHPSKPKVFGNRCEWAANGNGNLSSYDFGMSITDAGTNLVTDFDISGNTFINSAWGSIGVYGSGGTAGNLTGAVTNNFIFGSNQISNVNNCGIELSGTAASKVQVANNVFGDIAAGMTYNVCEQNNGTGSPDNSVVSLNLGPSGSSGYVNLVGASSKSILLPAHTGQLATLAGVEDLSNKNLVTPGISFATGASSTVLGTSINTGFQNSFGIDNNGTASNSGTVASSSVSLSGAANAYLQMVITGGASPTASLTTGAGVTGNFNIFAAGGTLVVTSPAITNPVVTGSFTATGLVTNAALATMATNTVKGNATSGTASPTNLAMTSCSTASSAVIWTTNTGFGCNTSITASTNANLTGPITSVGNATSIASQTGTGTTFAMSAAPTFTGIPLTTTAAVDTNTTQIASTAFVIAQAASATPLIDGSAAVGTSTRFARGDHVHPTDTTRAALASPTFTGTPLTTTAAVDTNTTQIASTAFVLAQAASATPLIDGTAAVGTSTRYARGDHIHPTDTTRAPLASPTFTGTVTIPNGAVLGTPTSGSAANLTSIPVANATGVLPAANGGVPSTSTNAAPTATCSGGTPTTITIDRDSWNSNVITWVVYTITLTNIGSCVGILQIPLPSTATKATSFSAVNTSTGAVVGQVNASSTSLLLYTGSSISPTFPGSNTHVIHASGFYKN